MALDKLEGSKTMLIITRDSKNNSIKIGDDIEIKVFETKGEQVRIGIEAPVEVIIVRDELVDN